MNNAEKEEYARKSLLALVDHVRNFSGGAKYLTYGELGERIGFPRPYNRTEFGRKMGIILSYMGHMLDDLVVDGEKPPMIQTLIVSQTSKLPSDGLKEFYPDYPGFSTAKKQIYVQDEYRRVFEFGERWEKVLDLLHLPSVSAPQKPSQHSRSLYNPYGAEGSPEHRRLRDYIADQPQLFGLTEKAVVTVENLLKSGDKVDVLFATQTQLVAVEVKSRRSGLDDIERSIFQCIKYQAVIEAEEKWAGSNRNVHTFLVLEGKLSRGHKILKNKLQVNVRDTIEPFE